MKRKLMYLASACVLMILFLRNCNPIINGAPGVSKTILESRQRGVFVQEIYPDCVDVKHAWIEQQWWFSAWQGRVNKDDIPKQTLVAQTSGRLREKIDSGTIRMVMNNLPINCSLGILQSPSFEHCPDSFCIVIFQDNLGVKKLDVRKRIDSFYIYQRPRLKHLKIKPTPSNSPMTLEKHSN
jgi:hypothetical protein